MNRGGRRAPNGSPNLGPRRAALRPHNGQATYVLSGPLAWIERGAHLAVLRVQGTNRRARCFLGRTVTLALQDARLTVPDRDADGRRTIADLIPGEHVTVHAALPRKLLTVPEVVAARVVLSSDWTGISLSDERP